MGTRMKSVTTTFMPLEEISFPVSAAAVASTGSPHAGQLQTSLGTSLPHSEHFNRATLPLPLSFAPNGRHPGRLLARGS